MSTSPRSKKAKPRKAGAPRQRPGSDALLTALRRYVRAKNVQLLQDPNVTSVGVGYKQTAGETSSKLSIQFTVGSKVVPEAISGLGSSPIPPTIQVGERLVPTDVIERTYKPTYVKVQAQEKDPRKARADVVAPGMSVGNLFTTAGTVGAFVRDRETRNVLLLSNWHVLHGPQASLGVDVVQPGRHDDNRVEQNKIGTLLRSHLGAAGDCAVATLSGRSFTNEVFGLGTVIGQIGDPEIGDRVVKSGRTTGVTQGKVVRIEVNTKIAYGGGVAATVGGFEIGIDDAAAPPEGELSRGGDSGAAWLALDKNNQATDVMLGLHFAGDADGTTAEFALACYAESVMTALEVEPVGAAVIEASTLADGLVPREGFDRQFLAFPVDEPHFLTGRERDLAQVDGDTEIRYCHYSAWLSRSRKYPLCVAWNIDGNNFKRLNRTNFRTDRRGDLAKYQLTDAIYVRNALDKGHIARRADLCWGTLDEARQGNYDSFYYTNIVPQHEAFNQSGNTTDDPEGGVWGRLENTVFDSESPHKLRISVMGGPVFGPNDRKFVQNGEECLVPDEFWKLIAFTDDKDNREKVFAFLLTQKHLVEPLTVPESLDLEPWLWARVTLRDLEARTGVRFSKAVHRRESPFVAPQSVSDVPTIKLLLSPSEYFA